ncbi:MAG: glycosyltransferase [Defluviicoccus sp.]|nr:glycosyltransferase [Defluviicoccus sp.]MDE0276651.1 glycosyltransferase [Defluviicoccus sp.]
MAHIAMLIPSLGGGGAERTVLRTAGGLLGRGHRVDIVAFEPTVAYPGEVPGEARLIVLCGHGEWRRRRRTGMPDRALWRPERAPIRSLVSLVAGLVREFSTAGVDLLRRAALSRALRFVRYLERERPDVVFANLPQAEYAALLAARLLPRAPPIVPVMRNTAEPNGRHARRRRLLLPASARIVAVSRGVADSVSALAGVGRDRIDVIYNPAVTAKALRCAGTAPDHPWFRDDGPPVVLGVGRLAPQKDFPTLIEAFRRVLAERPCRLLILGEGPLREELENLVSSLGLEDRVSMPGWADDPYAFMSRARLFVLSSRHEGFPGVLVEALACGCPSVSTDCPAGPSEILEDAGLLAPVGDPEALAAAMLRALARPADPAAQRAISGRFSLERAVEGYDGLVRGLANGGGEDGQK